MVVFQVHRSLSAIPIQILAGFVNQQRGQPAAPSCKFDAEENVCATYAFYDFRNASASAIMDACLAVLQELCRDIHHSASQSIH